MQINYYYSKRQIEHGAEEDDMLVLCNACAGKHRDEISHRAQRGDEDSCCEFCDATQHDEA